MELRADGISKRFGNTRALSGVSARLTSGRIHALAGENGAGKSTLLKILAGVETPDEGTLQIDGAPYAPRSLRDAEQRGVALVFQELTINPSLGIAENIYIDRLRHFTGRFGLLNESRLQRAAQEIIDRLDLGISVRQSISTLDLGQLKCLEICRALSSNPSLILLDEATAFLGRREVAAVLEVMRTLRDSGLTLAFVSHHIHEVLEVADCVLILKDGHFVAELDEDAMSADIIHAQMVGRAVSADMYPPRPAPRPRRPVLELQGVMPGAADTPTDLTLHEGEIVGLAGLRGAGGEDLIAVVAGDRLPAAGRMRLQDAPYAPRYPGDAWARKVAHLPGDRAREGLIGSFSVLDNLVMAVRPRRGPFFDQKAATRIAEEAVRALSIKVSAVSASCLTLSGGNLQKVLLGKCLAAHPVVLLLNQPTRGVDVGAREDIYRVIRAMADGGMAVLMLSEDLPEVLGLSDRVVVMRRGAVSGQFDLNAPCTEEDVVRCMV
jgi:ABC-type sugar transport system ATPase subunit